MDGELPRPAPPARRARVRWGIGDFFWVLGAQWGGAALASLLVLAPFGSRLDDEQVLFLVLLPGQTLAMAVALWVVSRRKGRGTWRADFGFRVVWRDWTAVLVGFGWRILLVLALIPFLVLLDADRPSQQIVEDIEDARSVAVWVVIFASVAVVQPLLEEVLFRGLLLRSLLRRLRPGWAVVVSGASFGAIHLLGVRPGLEAVVTVVGLSGFGMFLAVQALRHGSLSRPILTHGAFNLTVVVALAAG